MKDTFRLKAVQDLAQRRNDNAAAHLGTLNSEAAKAETKLNMLLQYREEYRARYRAAVQNNLHSAGWKNFHDFLEKLDEAIEQQRAAVLLSRQAVQRGRAAWQSAQKDVRAYDTLAQRHSRAEADRMKRADQRVMDEFASRKHNTKR
ncbi:MAG: flagellar export protein FliJ [Burkholderiales bacterium]